MALAWLSFLNFGGSAQGAAGYLLADPIRLQPVLQAEGCEMQPVLQSQPCLQPAPELVGAYA
jgi:hypothetical protein